MQTLTFDQFEFDNHGTEESLEIKIAARSDFPFPTFGDFVAGLRLIGSLPEPKPFFSVSGIKHEAAYLEQFGRIEVPSNCDWPCYDVPCDPDQRWLLIEAGDLFISYFWETSA